MKVISGRSDKNYDGCSTEVNVWNIGMIDYQEITKYDMKY